MKECGKKSFFIVAGEASGDIHGGALVRALKKKCPEIEIFGIGGDDMAASGVEIIRHISEMSLFGFSEILKHVPSIFKLFQQMKDIINKRRPELAILIDYPGFNLRLAKMIKKQGIDVIYYISPQVWAWGKRRIERIAKCVDRMLVIFPFEESIYRNRGVDAFFVGHPLKESVKASESKIRFFNRTGLSEEKITVGLLPGSRKQEVERLLPEMVRAVSIIKKRVDKIQFILAKSASLGDDIYERYIKDSESAVMVRQSTYEVMAYSDIVIVASGTATLETAILGTPMVIVYKVSIISEFIIRAVIRLRNVGLVNIVAGRTIVPELLQRDAKAKRIAEEVINILSDEKRREKIKKDLMEVSRSLGGRGASERAAERIIEFLN